MLLEVEGIVLSETPYGETSKIINLYTKEKGLIGIMCKGAKSMKSMFRASTQVLSYGIFNLHYKEGKLSTLTGVDIIDPLINIKEDLKKITTAFYLIKLITQVLKDTQDPKIYDLFISTILKINEGFDETVLCNILEIKLLPFLGVTLCLDGCIRCGSKKEIVTIDKKEMRKKIRTSRQRL